MGNLEKTTLKRGAAELAGPVTLESLKARCAAIENRPVLGQGAVALGRDGEAGLLVAPAGLVHEVFVDETRNSGAGLGFALAQARSLFSPARPVVVYLQMLAESQEMGLPYGLGLAGFSFDPERLVLVRPKNIAELLWAGEEALACRAVAGVIADVAGYPKALDFTASRRLSLRTAQDGASIWLLRYGSRREASAAQLRWHITPAPSAPSPFDARAPDQLRWRIRLEKGALTDRQNQQWTVGWTKNGFQLVDDRHKAGGDGADGRTALPGAVPAQLGDRLSQTA